MNASMPSYHAHLVLYGLFTGTLTEQYYDQIHVCLYYKTDDTSFYGHSYAVTCILSIAIAKRYLERPIRATDNIHDALLCIHGRSSDSFTRFFC